MAIKDLTWAAVLIVPVVILVGAALALARNLMLGMTPSSEVLGTALLAAVLLAAAFALGLAYTRLDAQLRSTRLLPGTKIR